MSTCKRCGKEQVIKANSRGGSYVACSDPECKPPAKAVKKKNRKRRRVSPPVEPAASSPSSSPSSDPAPAPSPITSTSEIFERDAASIPDVIGDVPPNGPGETPTGGVMEPQSPPVGWPAALCAAIYAMFFLALSMFLGDFWKLSDEEREASGPIAAGAANELWPSVEFLGAKAFLLMLVSHALPRAIKTDWKKAFNRKPLDENRTDRGGSPPPTPPPSPESSPTETSSASSGFSANEEAENLPKWGENFRSSAV